MAAPAICEVMLPTAPVAAEATELAPLTAVLAAPEAPLRAVEAAPLAPLMAVEAAPVAPGVGQEFSAKSRARIETKLITHHWRRSRRLPRRH